MTAQTRQHLWRKHITHCFCISAKETLETVTDVSWIRPDAPSCGHLLGPVGGRGQLDGGRAEERGVGYERNAQTKESSRATELVTTRGFESSSLLCDVLNSRNPFCTSSPITVDEEWHSRGCCRAFFRQLTITRRREENVPPIVVKGTKFISVSV